jgi:hypothetical protein
MLRVVPGSIPGETLLLHVREVFLDVVRKKDEFGGVSESCGGCVGREAWQQTWKNDCKQA